MARAQVMVGEECLQLSAIRHGVQIKLQRQSKAQKKIKRLRYRYMFRDRPHVVISAFLNKL
jgi:hypothetical protein